MRKVKIPTYMQPYKITINGVIYPYSDITNIWHVPQRSAYAIQCQGQMAAIPYEENNAQLAHALMAKVAQALHMDIPEYTPHAAQPRTVEPEPVEEPAQEEEPTEGEEFKAEPAEEESAEGEETEAEPAEEEPAEEEEAAIAESPGILGDRRFVIQMCIGIALIIIGFIGFVIFVGN